MSKASPKQTIDRCGSIRIKADPPFPSEKLGADEQQPESICRLHGHHPILGGILQRSQRILVKRFKLHPLNWTETCYEPIALANRANGNRLAVQDDLERRPQRRVGI
jgi:hypothetical protein